MAFTNVETDAAHFRVIFTEHWKPSSSRQMPSNAAALMTEGMAAAPENAFHIAEKGSSYVMITSEYEHLSTKLIPATDTIKLRSFARKRGLPIVVIEPIMELKALKKLRDDYDRSNGAPYSSVSAFAGFLFTEALMQLRLNIELPRNGVLFQHIDAFTQTEVGRDTSSQIRDLLMADTAIAFAEQFSQSSGVSLKPVFAVAVNIMHTGIVRALEMPPEERVRQITDNECFPNYEAGNFQAVFSKFDNNAGRWERYTFENHHFT